MAPAGHPHVRGSDGSYSSFSSSSCSSRGDSAGRNYVDPWDLENALYVRGKRISFASDPGTYCAASAAIQHEDEESWPQGGGSSSAAADSGYCYCEGCEEAEELSSQQERLASLNLMSFCPFCDALPALHQQQQLSLHGGSSVTSAAMHSMVPTAGGDAAVDTCSECSAACSSVAPPPPLLLFSSRSALSAAGLRLGASSSCRDCELQAHASFRPTPRRVSAPAPPSLPLQLHAKRDSEQLAYVYETPRARAKHCSLLPAADWPLRADLHLPDRWQQQQQQQQQQRRHEERGGRRLSLAACSLQSCSELQAEPLQHAPLLAPPRHPCRWGMARSGHVAIDYSNAWMSLARRIRPSRS